MSRNSVLITVCTYGRAAGLASLLDSVASQIKTSDRVVVVDNNPDASATRLLEHVYHWAEFVHEQRAGIPAARNRALAELRDEWAIIFVDDDEVVAPGWLDAHRRYAAQSDGSAFFGPVISQYGSGADPRVVSGRILDRARRPTGDAMPFGATNNTLVKRAAVFGVGGNVRFDERFTQSGGSDVDYFARLKASGAVLLWNDEAIVYERVPDDRATVAWSKKRYRRMGHNMAHLQRAARSDGHVLVSAAGRLLLGSARLPVERLRGRVTQAGSGRVWMAQGMLEALRGGSAHEYVRKD